MAGERPLATRRALVIGGSGGIGRACVRRVAELGARLVVHGGSDGARLQSLLHELRRLGHTADGFLAAVASRESCDTLLWAVERYLPVDILIVSFGPFLQRSLTETTLDEWRRMLDCNLVLPAALVTRVLPPMLAAGFGRIILFGVAGVEELRGYREIPAYAAAKCGLASLVRSTALLTRGRNVTINAICPGYVDTEYNSPQQTERYRRRQGVLLDPDTIAAEVACLVHPDSGALNGTLRTVQ